MTVQKLDLLPLVRDVVETSIVFETINYEYGTGTDAYGDREVVDKSRRHNISMELPIISFLDWIETLCSLKSNGVNTIHMYTKQIVPYEPYYNRVWGYFNEVNGNLLSNGYKYQDDDKVRIYLYLIEEFNYFAILRLLSHHDIVS